MRYFSILDSDGGGGGDKLPDPPKNYNPLSVQQRADWNGFLDYAGKQNINLSDPKSQAVAMSQYKKANPNFSVTADQIPAIQYEAAQLRKGNSFGSLGAKELGYIRQGMNPNFLNADVSNIAKTYYPQMGAYGTDLENYYNSKFNPSAAKPVTAPPPANATTVAPATAPKGAIPLPNYDDQKSRDAYLDKFAPKYGDFVHNRGDTIIHVNEVPDGGTMTPKESATKFGSKLGLDPALLYSSAMEEGMSGRYPDKNGNVDKSDSDKYPVDGFHNYGLDNFHDQFKTMVQKGYLPKDFDYQKAVNTNEKGEKVNSANFKSDDDAMQAKAAYMKMEQDNIDNYAKQKGIPLSDKARQFFTLVNFNGGSAAGPKMMDYYQKKGLLKDDKFADTPPEPGQGLGEYYQHIHPRLQMADLLKKETLFP